MYVDAIYDRTRDVIRVAERDNGVRVMQEFPAEHVFYYEHPAGTHRSIFGDTCKKFTTSDSRKFRKELEVIKSKNKKIFESDINPVFRCLCNNYLGLDAPALNVAFFDIEVDWSPERGFAPVDDPFNKITAITVYLSPTKDLITLVLPPKGLSQEDAQEMVADLEGTIVCETEEQMIEAFIDSIEDIDLISGFNSTFFDLPYIINRIKRIYGPAEGEKLLRQISLWAQMPRVREIEKFGKVHKTYDIVGRVHLDYLELYQKHNAQQLHSYRLDYVGEVETGEKKIPYEGTLDDLYNKEFRKFVEYNRQDVMLLVKIDEKRKYIELANQIAHSNGVLLKTTMGSVALVEQSITNEMHAMGFVVPNRKDREKSFSLEDDDVVEVEAEPVVGAYVADPKKGLHEMVACCDLNSLYPSTIRALNMSPETIVGQFRPDETDALIAERIAAGVERAEAWEGIFHTLEYGHIMERDDTLLVLDYDDGRSVTKTGAEWYDYIFDPRNHLCVTANGTVFRTDKEGMIPMLLEKWYAERKSLQKTASDFEKIMDGYEIDPALAEKLIGF